MSIDLFDVAIIIFVIFAVSFYLIKKNNTECLKECEEKNDPHNNLVEHKKRHCNKCKKLTCHAYNYENPYAKDKGKLIYSCLCCGIKSTE